MTTRPYAIYFGATRTIDGVRCNLHSVAVVMAASRGEALGKAHRIREKVYPASKGWVLPDAVAIPADHVTDIDDWQEYRGVD